MKVRHSKSDVGNKVSIQRVKEDAPRQLEIGSSIGPVVIIIIIIIIINFIIPVIRRSLCTGLIYVLANT
jgi:hypothetical protein